MKKDKTAYENDVATLVGRCVKRVRYFEIKYDSESTYYSEQQFSGHILDYGCDLEMADGSIFGIMWDAEFFQYGIGSYKHSLAELLPSAKLWDVTENSYWVNLIGQKITKSKVYWSIIEYQEASNKESSKKIEYPQDIELTFSNDSVVFISASDYSRDTNRLHGMADTIAIIFDHACAKNYGVGRYHGKISLER